MKKTAFVLLIALLISLTACGILPGSSESGSGKAYTVKFDSNGGTPVSDTETNQLTEAPATSKDGQIFCGWYQDSDLKVPVSYPLNVKENITLYAKWTNATERLDCVDSSVQFSYDNSLSYAVTYDAVPKSLDLKALAEQGYYIRIDATYDVYYEKAFDSPFDIGYLGAPDHDVCLMDIEEKGITKSNLPTSTEPTAESISLVVSAAQLFNTKCFLKVMTYNLQNVVYFKNVKITFTCQPTE